MENLRFKMRAWDNVADEMLYCGEDTSVLFILGSEGIKCTDVRNVKPNGSGAKHMDHLKYMQYTGLTLNGKEVYEGDVYAYHINVASIQGVEFSFERTSVVEFRNGAFWVGDYLLSEALEGDDSPKIVGNIYENPELVDSHEN